MTFGASAKTIPRMATVIMTSAKVKPAGAARVILMSPVQVLVGGGASGRHDHARARLHRGGAGRAAEGRVPGLDVVAAGADVDAVGAVGLAGGHVEDLPRLAQRVIDRVGRVVDGARAGDDQDAGAYSRPARLHSPGDGAERGPDGERGREHRAAAGDVCDGAA